MTERVVPYDPRVVEEEQQLLWEREKTFATPELQDGQRAAYIKTSAIFPSGPLHLGHVRHLVLADIYARYLRSRGEGVLMAFVLDAFGPTAAGAAEARGLGPEEWVACCSAQMMEQAKRLGISFDYERGFSSSHLGMYRWPQWLYLYLCKRGIIGDPSEGRLDLSGCLDEDRLSLARIGVKWNKCAHGALSSLLSSVDDVGTLSLLGEGLWGVPTPLLHCSRCGVVPMPMDALPVLHTSIPAPCPLCNGVAQGDHRVLSSRFDPLWLWMAPCVPQKLRDQPVEEQLKVPEVRKWLPAAQLIAGSDSGRFVLHQRLITKVLRDLGPLSFLQEGEPFEKVIFHEMVSSSGEKMSKHLGNGVTPDELLDEYGADALRLALLHISPLGKPLQWQENSFRAELRWCRDHLSLLWEMTQEVGVSTVESAEDNVLGRVVHGAMERHQPHLAIRHIFDALIVDPGPREVKNILTLLTPMAPHLCEQALNKRA